MEVSSEDISEAVKLLNELKGQVAEVSKHVQMIQERVDCGAIRTAKGISFLEVKYQLLLSYLLNVTQVAHCKVAGRSLVGDAAIDRLVEIRTVLEKMRPIDQKLKYQIDKLIKVASTGLGDNDPLRFKPNPGNLMNKLEDEESGSSNEEEKEDKNKEKTLQIYRPPKLAAVPYEGDMSAASRKEKQTEMRRKKSLSREIISDLQREIGDAPEEIQSTVDIHHRRAKDQATERARYEEDNFIRTQPNKREKRVAGQMFRNSGLRELERIGGFGEEDGGKNKKRKLSGKGKKRKIKAKGSKKKRVN